MKVLSEPRARTARCAPGRISRCRDWSSERLEIAARHRVVKTELLIAALIVGTALWILWRVT